MHNPKEQKKMPHARENFRYIPFLFQKFREARNLLEPESLGCNLWGTEVKAKYDDHLQATLFDKKQSIAEPSRAALLGGLQIMTYKNCLLEKPET